VRTHSRFEYTLEVTDRIYRKSQHSERRASAATKLWQAHALSNRLGTVTLAELVEDYLAGDGSTILARRFGISENAVLAHLKHSGVELRPAGKVTPDDVIEMHRLRKGGWTYQAIGEKFGITRVAVRRRLMPRTGIGRG
jgi:hypothetical protein